MRIAVAFLICIFLTACAHQRKAEGEKPLPPLSLERIADNVWVHKSYEVIEPWGPILSQGLVVKTDAGVFLVDTAWNDADTEILLALVKRETGETPKAAIVTHAHNDKMGGMDVLAEASIPTFMHQLTKDDAIERGLLSKEAASFEDTGPNGAIVAEDFKFMWLDRDQLTAFYPGPGHTRDNIVVYHADTKTLFGGCLIRPARSISLGNTADADIANWADAVANVAAEFPDAEIVIPSHGPAGGRDLLDHTIALAEAANE